MFFVMLIRRPAMDEEMILRQKTKIQWLKIRQLEFDLYTSLNSLKQEYMHGYSGLKRWTNSALLQRSIYDKKAYKTVKLRALEFLKIATTKRYTALLPTVSDQMDLMVLYGAFLGLELWIIAWERRLLFSVLVLVITPCPWEGCKPGLDVSLWSVGLNWCHACLFTHILKVGCMLFWVRIILGIISLSFGHVSFYYDSGLINLSCGHVSGLNTGFWKCNTIYIIDKGSRLEWLKDFSSDLVRILGSLNFQVLKACCMTHKVLNFKDFMVSNQVWADPPSKVGFDLKLNNTRTLNPESGDTMKHRSILELGELLVFSDGVSSRMNGFRKDEGMSDMNESELIFGSIGKESVVSNNSNVGVKSKIVNDFPSAGSVSVNKNDLGSSGNDDVPEMPVPFDENPILNLYFTVIRRFEWQSVNMKEVRVPGMFKIVGDGSLLNKGVGSVSNFEAGDRVKREVAVMDPVLEEGIQKWSMTVVGHFVGFQMGYREILGHLKRMWHLFQLEEVIVNQGLYYFNFKSQEGMNSVIENGPWMVENKPLFVRKWEPGLCMSKLDTSKVPLWVKIYDIPLEAWNVDGISRIASRIGSTSFCEKPFGRALYAKVLVEVDAAKGLIDTVEIWFCSKGLANVEKKVGGDESVKNYRAAGNVVSDQEGWQNVGYRRDEVVKSSSNVGVGMSNVKSNSKKESGNLEMKDKASDGISKDIDVEVSNVWEDVRARITTACNSGLPIAEEEINKWPDDIVKLIVQLNENLHVNARANALRLVKETDEATGVKSNSNMYTKFYDQSCREDLIKVEELQWERRRAEVDLFMLTKRPLMDDFKEIWTDDMVEYFLERCEEIKNDEKNGHYADDSGFDDMEEVGEDVSGSANFVTQNEVSSDIDGSMAQMQGKKRKPLWRNLSEHNMLVSNEPWVVLGDFNVIMNTDECSNSFNIVDRDMDVFRRVLHSLELEDIVSYGMFYTWIQKRRNPEAGMLKKLDRILGNASFLSSYASCFAKFLTYKTSDHCPAIIVYPDVKGFKPRSFRFMNFLIDKPEFLSTVKDNWYSEVHEFYMFVLAKREELKRVHNCLDKDPDCVHLREEEYVFCNAYKEAARDEEMILRQKTKIQWLKDGDQNSAYFHNSLKGRMFRNRIEVVYDSEGHKYEGDYNAPKFVDHFSKFLGTEDEVFPIEDPDSLFINKLDAQCADYMVRLVLDDEIKFAMFSIEDDKAAGMDSYTLKFFKTDWNIVGGDVYAAVKEFFYSSKLLREFNANLISLVPKLQT
ncbi:RNA-directed DNA polymerase, eukaryota, reverse transcriptase zinc-binding domain protein, partial [Tanacetum coccineum]